MEDLQAKADAENETKRLRREVAEEAAKAQTMKRELESPAAESGGVAKASDNAGGEPATKKAKAEKVTSAMLVPYVAPERVMRLCITPFDAGPGAYRCKGCNSSMNRIQRMIAKGGDDNNVAVD